MKIDIKLLDPRAVMPTYGSLHAAGMDLYAVLDEEITIPPHENRKINTGIAIAIPEGYWGILCARSGLATKRHLRPANGIGTIDADFRGEILVALHNDSSFPQTVTPGERIAQLVIAPCVHAELNEVNKLDETERGGGGFGSTGTH